MRRALPTLFAVFAAVVGSANVAATSGEPLLLRTPTVSATSVVFAYADDLWIVGRDGGAARRLTNGVGIESHPLFSPDGKTVAFSGEYDGNIDLYVVAASGGEPRRRTWHPGDDELLSWSADGANLLFLSSRSSGTDDAHLFSVPAAGGWPERLPLPSVWMASPSPDGKRLAYVPHGQWQRAWKRYRGGQTTPIWLVDLASLAVEKIPRDNSNDSWPMWVGGAVYFLSDRDSAVALYRYDTASRQVTRALANDGLDLKSASAGPGAIAVERFGEIGLYDVTQGKVKWLDIQVDGDLPGVRPRWADVGEEVTGAGISPGGKRAVFAARGDIFTVPAEKGDIRNLTHSSSAADRDPSWSPDGKTIAWLSDGSADASGEYALHLAPQDGSGEARRIALGEPPSFFYEPLWSPDGKRIALYDKRLTLWIVDVAGGGLTKVASDLFETPYRTLEPAWSPDSRYLAYTRQLPSHLHAIFVYALDSRTSTQATDGLSDARFPAFDRGGKYLYFTASTNWGPAATWLDMSSVDHPVSRAVYVAVLDRKEPSPLAPESDEEGEAAKGDESAAKGAGKTAATKSGGEKGEPDDEEASAAKVPVVRIDFDRLSQRTLALPVPVRNYSGLRAGKAGEIFLLEAPAVEAIDSEEPPTVSVQKFDLAKRKVEKLADDVRSFALSADGEKMLLESAEKWSIAGTAGPVEADTEETKTLDLSGMQAYVDPRAEWRQMYHEAWRIQRDFLYDPHAHGLDLAAAERKYSIYLPGLGSRTELNYLFEEMLGEVGVGHMFVGGGDLPEAPKVPGGLLGADYDIANGRYRFARVYDGESWNPKLRAPLTQPGVDVLAGEYLIAVDGRDVRPPASVYGFFENRAGKSVRLRVAKDAAGKEARDVTVVPVADEEDLRYRAWVEDNRRTVDRLSGGKLAYVHLPDTGAGGFLNFNRYFFSQTDKLGMVVDERFNHGGLIADYIVDYLNRPQRSLEMGREGQDFRSPGGSIQGPKVMLINEMSGSGGDALPWYFRKANSGKLVGTRTWGGLVGIYDYPTLLDGGGVTAPRVAIYGLDGKWEVENQGIPPDVEVERLPADCRDGNDPQLAKGVEILLDELAKSPPPTYQRPPFPNYQKTPWESEAKP
ncbi:MAG: PD40 domain-containing protein [Thermoanaerobaculia bacterium]|nr:PD40 domain-containing protein [Thermoanaerobaculia bacterium]